MTTRLDIINAALLATSVSPVSSYDSTHPTVQNIDPVINKISKQVQATGWWFNKDYNLTLTADASGKVVVPSNTMSIDPVDSTSSLVKRGKYLYDPVAHTFILNTSVKVNVIVELDIDELPESAGQYILERVVNEYYVNDDGDLNKARALAQRVVDAKAEFKKDELKNSDVNSNYRPAVLEMKSGIGNTGSYGVTYNPDLPGG